MEIEEFKLKDGRIVTIKRLTMKDYNTDNNYEYVHDWLYMVNDFLALEFEKEDLKRDRANFELLMSNEEEFIMVGAIYFGKIIASANLKLSLKNKKMRHIGNWGIAIHPRFQNQGLGKRILEIFEKFASDIGLKKLETEFFSANKVAEKLYIEKMNYIIEGKRRFGAKLKNGTYVDRILIGKIIEGSFLTKN